MPSAPAASITCARLMLPFANAGIWTPGGVTSDGTSLFAVSGNTDGATYWQGGNGVFKFQSGPTFTNDSVDYFAPSQWLLYDQDDIDLCGSEPVRFFFVLIIAEPSEEAKSDIWSMASGPMNPSFFLCQLYVVSCCRLWLICPVRELWVSLHVATWLTIHHTKVHATCRTH